MEYCLEPQFIRFLGNFWVVMLNFWFENIIADSFVIDNSVNMCLGYRLILFLHWLDVYYMISRIYCMLRYSAQQKLSTLKILSTLKTYWTSVMVILFGFWTAVCVTPSWLLSHHEDIIIYIHLDLFSGFSSPNYATTLFYLCSLSVSGRYY